MVRKESQKPAPEGKDKLGRRDFIRGMAATLAAVTVAGACPKTNAAESSDLEGELIAALRANGGRLPLGKVRQTGDALADAGILEGDIIRTALDLPRSVEDGRLCCVFTPSGKLIVRYVARDAGGRLMLKSHPLDEPRQRYAPEALMIFGRVERVERDGRRVRGVPLDLADFPAEKGGR